MGRERWTGRTAFLLAAIGSAVGLGNVWRFPYIASKNGGGAFLIPYFIALFTAGIPLLILETGLGQKLQGSAAASYAKVRRNMEWLGWFSLAIGLIIASYYAVVLAWCSNYVFHSLGLSWVGPGAETFFTRDVLMLSSGPSEIGGIVSPVLAGLLGAWIVALIIIAKGIRWLGSFNKILLPASFVMLIVLLIRGVTLQNSGEGLNYFLTPDFAALKNPQVWLAAYSQIFFTLSVGFGILIAYASYRPDDADVANNAFITGLSNSGVEFVAGLTVFSTIGYLAAMSGTPVDSMTVGGPGLAFQTYPTAIGKIPHLGSFYGTVFFTMLLILGLTSLVSLVEAVVTGLRDKFSITRRKATFIVCTVGALMGLIYSTRAGLYWLDIVDHWALTYGLVVIGIVECIFLGWVFDIGSLRKFVNEVSEIKLGRWWEICIKFVTPAALTVSLLLSISSEVLNPYGGYPTWAVLTGGWALVTAAVLVGMVFMRIRNRGVAVSATAIILVVAYIELSIISSLRSSDISTKGMAMLCVGLTVLFGGLLAAVATAAQNEKRKKLGEKTEAPLTTL
ncbi:MAG: sodium-dependent transporter [Candidatus Eisenbacteria bacterium]